MKVNTRMYLTPKQKKVLDFIQKYAKENGYSPSLRNISAYLNKSLSTVQHYVEELGSKGFLHKEDNVVRGISPVEAARGRIFLLADIAAGEPIETVENPEPIDVPVSMISRPGDYYALRVRGESMVNDNILNGDIIIVRYQKTAQDGDRVVAVTENGATLKVYHERNGKIYLEPRNKALENIYPKELEIRGKFCGLIRRE